MANGQPRIDYGRVFNVAPNGASLADFLKIATAAYNTNKQTVGFSYDDAGIGDLSNRRAVLWDIPIADRPGFVAFFAQWYPGVVVEFKQTGTNPVDPPPPVATGKMRLGVNVITGDAGVMNRALAAGCTAISGINMFGQLADMAAQRPDVTFMARRYVNGMPPPDPDVVFEGAQSPHVWYLTPLNECDVQCNGTPQQIRERAAFDKTMFERMQAKGRRYCGFGFSVGTAEYTNPDVVAAMREVYAPLYARGMGFNGHFYRPWRTHNPDEWYEGRWRFLFGTGPMECGFDPNPNLAGIFCDECGLDEGSLGGFNAAGWGPDRVEAWCREFMSYSQSQPYGGLFRAAVIFQAGNKSTAPGGWAGYDVDTPDMLAAIGRAAQAPIAPWVTPRAMPTPDAEDGVPRQLMTGRKVIAQWESQP